MLVPHIAGEKNGEAVTRGCGDLMSQQPRSARPRYSESTESLSALPRQVDSLRRIGVRIFAGILDRLETSRQSIPTLE